MEERLREVEKQLAYLNASSKAIEERIERLEDEAKGLGEEVRNVALGYSKIEGILENHLSEIKLLIESRMSELERNLAGRIGSLEERMAAIEQKWKILFLLFPPLATLLWKLLEIGLGGLR